MRSYLLKKRDIMRSILIKSNPLAVVITDRNQTSQNCRDQKSTKSASRSNGWYGSCRRCDHRSSNSQRQSANAQSAAAAAAANVAQPPQGQHFACYPGAAGAGALDFNKSESIKLFNKAIAPVEPKYGSDESKLRIFIGQVRQRAKIYNWDEILTVTDTDGVTQNVITHYCKLSIDDCIRHAAAYINTETRKSQDSAMLFQYLRNSLTDEARLLMMADEDVYTIGGEADGIVFFKLIAGRAFIDTNAKVLWYQHRTGTNTVSGSQHTPIE
jgi:hypothetical protein